MKKNILIFCSWLETESNVGIFFREQAELVACNYNPILIVFKRYDQSVKWYNERIRIIEKKTTENLQVLEIFYPHYSTLQKKINRYCEQLALKSLHDYLDANALKIDFIHAQSLFDGGIWAYYYFIKFGTPYIITEHNQLSFYKVDSEKCDLILKSLENSKKNLVVSNDKIRQFVANGLFFDFENIGNLINKNFFHDEHNIKTVKQKFITIGAFRRLKDQNTLLKALQIVDQQISTRIEFIWIGYDGWGGNHDNDVKNLVSNFKFKNIDVLLIPLLSHKEIADYLQSAHLFLFSSLTEGMPVSVLEALACGLPVFTSNCGGVDEIVNEQNGVIYQIKDYQRLSELILDFLNHKINYDSKKISENIIQKFGENAFRNKLLSIYNSVA